MSSCSFGFVGFMRPHPGVRQVNSGLLGIFWLALGVVGFIVIHSGAPWRSSVSFAFCWVPSAAPRGMFGLALGNVGFTKADTFIRARPWCRRVHLGLLVLFVRAIGFIRVRGFIRARHCGNQVRSVRFFSFRRFSVLGVVVFIRFRWLHSSTPWGSFSFIRALHGVVMSIRVRWDQSGAVVGFGRLRWLSSGAPLAA